MMTFKLSIGVARKSFRVFYFSGVSIDSDRMFPNFRL